MPDAAPARHARGDLTLLDPLRLLANFLVVWHHMRGTDLFGVRVGVYLFLGIMFGLATSRTKPEPLWNFARRKATFLLVPWVRWSLIYLAVAAVAHELPGHRAKLAFDPWQLLIGGHPALWFLPMAAVALVAARIVQRGVERWSATVAMLVAGLLAIAATGLAAGVQARFTPVFPLESWLRSSPMIFWGVALGQSRRIETVARRRTALATVAALAALPAAALALPHAWAPWPAPPGDLLPGSAIAVALAAVGFAFRPRMPPIVHHLASFTYGIYLAHPLVAKVVATTLDVFAWPLAVHALVVWIASGLLIRALRRMRLRWIECVDLRRSPVGV